MASLNESPSLGKIFVTGANGFIGSAIVEYALRRGHSVRAAVRRQHALEQLRNAVPLQPYLSSQLEIILIEDLTSVASLKQAMIGCSAIIHVASPFKILTVDLGDLSIFTKAATQAVLQAAQDTPTLRNVVFTSSGYALGTYEEVLATHPTNQARLQGDLTAGRKLTPDIPPPPFTPAGEGKAPVERYVASKIAAYQETVHYMKQHPDCSFSVVNVMPGYIIGPHVLAKTKTDVFATTNCYLAFCFMPFKLGPQYGLGADVDHPLSAYTCHVTDAAEVHVKAAELSLRTGELKNYLAFSDGPHGPRWSDAVTVLKRDMPQLAQALPFPGCYGKCLVLGVSTCPADTLCRHRAWIL